MVFSEFAFPTPNYHFVSQTAELPTTAKLVGWPCVVKPVSLEEGKGVTAGIQTICRLEAAFALARRHTNEPVMIEAFVPVDDCRLTIIDGRVFAAARRQPSSVIGGKSPAPARVSIKPGTAIAPVE